MLYNNHEYIYLFLHRCQGISPARRNSKDVPLEDNLPRILLAPYSRGRLHYLEGASPIKNKAQI